MTSYARLAYTESVCQVQREQGSSAAADRQLAHDSGLEVLADAEAGFIESRDGFYLASVSETGWPYIQFRGGQPGFAQVLDERTIGWAELRGNRQYISTGNIRADGRVALFFMDYPRQARLKMFGRAAVLPLDNSPELASRLCATQDDGRPEGLMVVTVEAFAWNCPKHITPRYTQEELASVLAPVLDSLTALEEENRSLRAQLAGRG